MLQAKKLQGVQKPLSDIIHYSIKAWHIYPAQTCTFHFIYRVSSVAICNFTVYSEINKACQVLPKSTVQSFQAQKNLSSFPYLYLSLCHRVHWTE